MLDIYNYVVRNPLTIAIVIFIIAFYSLNVMRPAFLYNADGSLREFGLNSSRKTVLPVWFVALLMAIVSYIATIFVITVPRIQF